MDLTIVVYEKIDRVAKITMNWPEKYNPLGGLMLEELDKAFDAAVTDNDVRVIVLAGAGKNFSAGHDLGTELEGEYNKAHPYPPGFPGQMRRTEDRNTIAYLKWRDLPKPTIAMIHGYCIMAAYGLASTCDIIIASDDVKFADRAVRWGSAHIQYFSFPWELGFRKAKEYLFTGDYIDAQEAWRLGLVNRVVPRERLEEETMALANRIALQDSFALMLAKRSINETQDRMGFRDAILSAFKNYMIATAADARERSGMARQEGESVAEYVRRRDERFGDHL